MAAIVAAMLRPWACLYLRYVLPCVAFTSWQGFQPSIAGQAVLTSADMSTRLFRHITI